MPPPLLKIHLTKLNKKNLDMIDLNTVTMKLRIALNPINLLIKTYEITKTGALTTSFQKPVGEANLCVLFGYTPLTSF